VGDGHDIGSTKESFQQTDTAFGGDVEFVMTTIETLAAVLETHHDEEEIARVVDAYEFALDAHHGQVRKTGESYINHPLEAALILADLRLDIATIQAALLHDTIEDCEQVTFEIVQDRFGAEVAGLVDGVTKLGRIEFETQTQQQSESMRKMLIAMASDIRVILIKLADRLHNMRTLDALSADKQIEKSRETMEIFAPLAHRLGMSQIKWELEDLAFRHLNPEKYAEIATMVKQSRPEREAYTQRVMGEIEHALDEVGISAEIQGRPKHFNSIYQKMINKGKDFSEIYDLLALRIIVDNIKDVYGALGTVHNIYTPMPGRFKDYVAMPKFNMYQSLHTTVIGPVGSPLEIQIRTREMHRMAEYGVAAHWRYKEGTAAGSFDERLAWLRQMLEWQTELDDPSEFMEELKIDLFQEEVFVFTPTGDVKSLKRGATPLDFAFHIHTEVGFYCVGAKVNGAIVPLTYELQNGDRVEILTNKSTHPSRDWLGIVTTSSARSKIKAYFKKQELEGVKPAVEETEKTQPAPQRRAEHPKKRNRRNAGVRIEGLEHPLVKLARCCNPVPGDDIIGFVTRGRGVSIHRRLCPNAESLNCSPGRIIEVEWDADPLATYQVEVALKAVDRLRLLHDVTVLVADAGVDIISSSSYAHPDGFVDMRYLFEMSDLSRLDALIKELRRVQGVFEAHRMIPSKAARR
jgi:GTP pyrophosphokinase